MKIFRVQKFPKLRALNPTENLESEEAISRPAVNQKPKKYDRWGKSDDIRAFQVLSHALDGSVDRLKEFLTCDSQVFNDPKKEIESGYHNSIILQVMACTNWQRKPYHLLKRFVSLSAAQKFSVRDLKRLKKLCKRQKREKAYDFRQIADQFPGKDPKVIRTECKKVLRLAFLPF